MEICQTTFLQQMFRFANDILLVLQLLAAVALDSAAEVIVLAP